MELETVRAHEATTREASASTPHASELKGQLFHACLTALGAREGARAVVDVIARIEGPAGEALRAGRLHPSGWYPVAWMESLLDAAREVTGSGPELDVALGREALLLDRRGIFRPILSFASPERIFPFAPLVYSLYVRGPKQALTGKRRGSVHVVWSGCGGFGDGLRRVHVGATYALLALAGAEAPHVEQVDVGDPDRLELDVRWG